MTFRQLGIRFHVTLGFFLLPAMFAATERTGLGMALAFVALAGAFLLHELGHAGLAMVFGREPLVMLHAMGGVTAIAGPPLPRPQAMAVTLAGPAASALASMAAYAVLQREPAIPPWALELLRRVFLANSLVAAVNLLPVLPFDGGHILRETLGPRRLRLTFVLSAAVAAMVSAVFFRSAQVIPGFFAGGVLFAVAGLLSLRLVFLRDAGREHEAERTAAVRAALDETEALEERGASRDVDVRALQILEVASEPDERDRARRILVRNSLARGIGVRALAYLAMMELRHGDDDVLRAEALDLLGRRDDAFELLTRRATMDPRGPALLPLVRGLVATEQLDRAVDLVIRLAASASREAVLYLLGETEVRGAHASSLAVVRALGGRSGELADDATFARLTAELAP